MRTTPVSEFPQEKTTVPPLMWARVLAHCDLTREYYLLEDIHILSPDAVFMQAKPDLAFEYRVGKIVHETTWVWPREDFIT